MPRLPRSLGGIFAHFSARKGVRAESLSQTGSEFSAVAKRAVRFTWRGKAATAMPSKADVRPKKAYAKKPAAYLSHPQFSNEIKEMVGSLTMRVGVNRRKCQLYRKESTMKTDQIASFVLSVCSCLRLSQAKTLSQLVPAAMTLGRA